MHLEKTCLLPHYHFTPHCQWIQGAAFYNHNPGFIYHHIFKTDEENSMHHKICHCFQNGSNNCSIDTLGPVYPGQTLQAPLCTPCNDKLLVLYAEINSIYLPHTACKVVTQNNNINTISNYSSQVNFTILSEADNMCELFLTASSYSYNINEAFYVQLLPCPLGFTLQSGVCDCDPSFSLYTDACFIDSSSIKRPSKTWITAYAQTNNTDYFISDCLMDYCLPYSSNLNLLYPDSQCQFLTGLECCAHNVNVISALCLDHQGV